MATKMEPVEGFVDNYMGVTGLAVAETLGFIRTILWDKKVTLDIIPADYVINQTIAVGWDTYKRSKSPKNHNELEIYNCVSGCDNPIKLGKVQEYFNYAQTKVGINSRIWYPFLLDTTNTTLFAIYSFFLHTVPYHIIDFLLKCIGKKPFLTKIYMRYEKLRSALTFFTLKEWKFHTKNTRKLYSSLSEADKRMFNFDVTNIYWPDYFMVCSKGIRRYLLKENFEFDYNIKSYNTRKYIHLFSMCLVIIFMYYFFKIMFITLF
ncbi:unnamed protein product [Brassicogethes aeneus]|uniref:Fatty acyl-CoA reductase C-terminal domain-containing protein n=1 Tax=Brassicogethes aeneus TaxID=1431903 RepID=A0A9P0FDH7_BRAAE|nr:unnamed protein product [Brassicogethes aeneus]